MNGWVVADFDGSNDQMNSNLNWAVGPFTFFAVGIPDSVSAFQAILASPTGGSRQVAVSATGTFQVLRESSTTVTHNGGVFRAGVPFAFGVSYDSVPSPDVEQFQLNDGAVESQGVNIASLSGGNLRIGARSNSTNFYNGALAELIHFSRACSAAEITSTVEYLMTKWGIPSNYSHPVSA